MLDDVDQSIKSRLIDSSARTGSRWPGRDFLVVVDGDTGVQLF